jgi:DNA modification methylase
MMDEWTLSSAAEAKAHARPLPEAALAEIERLDRELSQQFEDRLVIESSLSRPLVSFQANKARAGYRWYKYKEAFSAALIEYLLHRYQIRAGHILDPFAGSGTSLFVASHLGLAAEGIELLPIGQQIIAARKVLEESLAADDLDALKRWRMARPWQQAEARMELPVLRITKGAYPARTQDAIERYLFALTRENERVRMALRFALLCVLEAVSYTRKDGQYLRWDHRSGRKQGSKPFNKGAIPEFDSAICARLDEMIVDLQEAGEPTGLFPVEHQRGQVSLHTGSCLEVLPALPAAAYRAVITSPPYCNRYDYTRTYALELALLGIGERELIQLRQRMLSCTVENRAKDLLAINPQWKAAINAADKQEALQAILTYLEDQKAQGRLNNQGIPRMVRGYFYEMACVIAECARVLEPGGRLLMVNDNVRYAGASISVDLILSDIAGQLGFAVESILVLPNGKGNSSQQMGAHGREPLRKCVYVWSRA